VLQAVFTSPTAEAALKYLRNLDLRTGSNWVNHVYGAIAGRLTSANTTFSTTANAALQLVQLCLTAIAEIIIKSQNFYVASTLVLA